MSTDVEFSRWGFIDRGGLREVHVMRSSKRKVELYVSPTGRSQRVFVDGVEVESS